MILAIRTDKPVSELYLCKDTDIIATYEWEAHRQLADTIHTKIEELLDANTITWNDISGLVVFRGPGSFTGLRIGITVANTIAYAQNVPIIGAEGDNWLQDGLLQLQKATDNKIVLPEYGGSINITTPKK
jgi:tRNA threonylcarbamoyladenosine biosynthesis protein TsaB